MDKKKSAIGFTKEDSLALKGVGILIMMGMHCFGSKGRLNIYTVDFWPLTEDQAIPIFAFFKICVALFAFISGFGLFLSAQKKCVDGKSTSKWVVDRYFKTFSGFWFVCIISIIVMQLTVQLPQEKYFGDGVFRGVVYMLMDFLGIADLFATPRLNGSWWYMSAAFFFVVMTPVLVYADKKIGMLTATIVAVVFPRAILESEFYGTDSAYSFFFIFCLGAVFAKYNLFEKLDNLNIKGKKAPARALLFIFLIVAIPLCVILWHRVPVSKIWELHYGISPLLVIVFCQQFIFKIPLVSKVLGYFGKHSMNMFLIHTFFRVNLFRAELYELENAWLIYAVLFVGSLICSIVIELFKKLIKYDLFINKISKKICDSIDR